MKFNLNTPVYGDTSFRGECHKEDAIVQTIVNQCRKRYPNVLFTHINNEGKRTKAQIDFDKSMGLMNGVSDLVFFGNPTGLLEVKRQDHTKSHWQPNQEELLLKAQSNGCFVGVCLGWEGGMQFIEEWLLTQK